MKNVALIFAGGHGYRLKEADRPKQFLELYGKPVIIYTIELFEHHPEIDEIVVVCLVDWIDTLVWFSGLIVWFVLWFDFRV